MLVTLKIEKEKMTRFRVASQKVTDFRKKHTGQILKARLQF
jgi:hypothetical protein